MVLSEHIYGKFVNEKTKKRFSEVIEKFVVLKIPLAHMPKIKHYFVDLDLF